AAGNAVVRARAAALRGQVQVRGGLLVEAMGTLRSGAALVAGTDPQAALEMLYGAAEAAGYRGGLPGVLEIAEQARGFATPTPSARILREWLLGFADVLSGDVARGGGRLRGVPDEIAGAAASPRWLMWAAYGATYTGDVGRMIELFESAALRA